MSTPGFYRQLVAYLAIVAGLASSSAHAENTAQPIGMAMGDPPPSIAIPTQADIPPPPPRAAALEHLAEPYAAPAWELPASTGKLRSSSELITGPTVLFFFEGYTCLRCVEPITLLAERAAEFKARGIQLIGVSTGSPEQLREGLKSVECPFPIVADPELRAFRDYGCSTKDGPLHGIFIIDRAKNVRLRNVAALPFMAVDDVLRASSAIASKIEVQIRNTAAPTDDYVDWAPAECRIRIVPGSGVATDLNVVLTNDAPAQYQGDVWFDRTKVAGKTASLEQLALTLPKDGAWVSFIVAGWFGRPSTADKDAIIEVHQESASGPLLGTQALMVRVRKDARKLLDHEWKAYLAAVNDLHFVQKKYELFVKLHDLAARGPGAMPSPWTNQSHQNAGFLPWHRAFLLQYERELQKRFPHVSLPYWRQDELTMLFAESYLGNNPSGETYVAFAPTNPLNGWKISYSSQGLLKRADRDHTQLPTTGSGQPLFKEDAVLGINPVDTSRENFRRFAALLESNPHNQGHNWVGEFMANCRISPSDPLFFLFHCEHDRLWAKWQRTYGRFKADGSDISVYEPVAAYRKGDSAPLGHHLPDTMWPWNGVTGGPSDDAKALRPDVNPIRAFEKSSVPGLWPEQDAAPAPAHMIDYHALDPNNPARLPHGTSYDDVPFGPQPLPVATTPFIVAQLEQARKEVVDGAVLPERRLRAAERVSASLAGDSLSSVVNLAQDAKQTPALRRRALALVFEAAPATGATEATKLLQAREQVPSEVSLAAVKQLELAMHFAPLSEPERERVEQALGSAVNDPRPAVNRAAITALAPMRDPAAVARLKSFLQSPKDASIPLPETISLLATAGAQEHAPLLRPQLFGSDVKARRSALLALSGDQMSEADRLKILRDNNEPTTVRVAASQSLMHDSTQIPAVALALLKDQSQPEVVREEAAVALRVAVQWRSAQITRADASGWLQEVTPVRDATATGQLRETLDMAVDALEAHLARLR